MRKFVVLSRGSRKDVGEKPDFAFSPNFVLGDYGEDGEVMEGRADINNKETEGKFYGSLSHK